MSQEPQNQTANPTATGQAEVQHIFAQIPPLAVEQFYTAYQLWQKQQQITLIQKQLAAFDIEIMENDRLMQAVQPSPTALQALEQLQTRRVMDIDVLETIITQDDAWLDHTMHLLSRCEELDLIGGDYTQWCENALEGAYDWIDSMNENSNEQTSVVSSDKDPVMSNSETSDINPTDQVTADQLLLKLMSEEGEEEQSQPTASGEEQKQQLPSNEHQLIHSLQSRQTHPLPPLDHIDAITNQWPYTFQEAEATPEQESSERSMEEYEKIAQPEVQPGPEATPSTTTKLEIATDHSTAEPVQNDIEKPHSDQQKQGFIKNLLTKVLGG